MRLSLWNLWLRSRDTPLSAERTTPPGRYVLLYDGRCKFCTAQVKNLLRLAKPGVLEAVSFQDPGVLERFPGVSHEACMRAMQLIAPDGRVYQGFEGAVRAVATRPVLGWIAYGYYLPGFRLVCDLLYALIARYRYHLLGRAVAAGECDGGTCALHVRPGTAATSRT
jgi:predicted DCC family thiol-disulfide oxidoreductase YuxK